MASTHFIIWHKQGEDDGIVLDGFKVAFKGNKEDMWAKYCEFYRKAQKLISLGDAKELKDSDDEDGTMSFSFKRNGNIIKTFFCDRKRAAFLLA